MSSLFALLGCTGTTTFAPVADAGDDQQVLLGETVTLDGTASSDLDGQVEGWAWRMLLAPRGSTASLSPSTGSVVDLTPDLAGQYVLALEVTDDSGETSGLDLVSLRVGSGNAPPEVTLEADATDVVPEALVMLSASGSDPEGAELSWEWSVQHAADGSKAELEVQGTEATFVPDLGGVYILSVRASDGVSWSQRADAVLRVDSPETNEPPTAICGDGGEVEVGTTVELDGTASTDPEGGALSYSWALAERPDESRTYLEQGSEAVARFTPDVEGSYAFKLQVSDGEHLSESCDVAYVAVEPPPTLCEEAILVDHLDDSTSGTAAGGSWSGARFFGGLDTEGDGRVSWSLDLGEAYTVAFWMATRPDETLQVVAQSDTWVLARDAGQLVYGRGEGPMAVDASLGDRAWRPYVLVVDGEQVSLYEEGELLGQQDVDGTADGGDVLRLGADEDGGAALTGAVDEVRVWARALSPEEIDAASDDDAQPCTDARDTDAPVLSVASPGDQAQPWVAVTGAATDASDVAWVTVNGEHAVATAPGFASWTAWVPVSSAGTSLQVEAEDVAGNSRVLSGSTVAHESTCYPDASLVLRFEERDAGDAADESSVGLPVSDALDDRAVGLIGNAAWHAGGEGLFVDGELASGAFTASAWAMRLQGGDETEVLGQDGRWRLGFSAARPVCIGWDEDGDSVVLAGEPERILTWLHVACHYDGTTLSLVLDGEVVDGASIELAAPGARLGVGTAIDEPLIGLVDEVVVHDSALSTEELAELADASDRCAVSDDLGVAATSPGARVGHAAALALDDNPLETTLTSWHTPDGAGGVLTVELDDLSGITDVRFVNTHGGPAGDRATADYAIWASATGAFAGEEELVAEGVAELDTRQRWEGVQLDAPVPATHVRFEVLGWHGAGGGLAEIEVQGVQP